MLASVLFIIALLLSRDSSVSPWESRIFHLAYDLPHLFYPLFYALTQFGGAYMLVVLACLYALKQHYHIVIRLLLSGTLAYFLAGFAKSLWGRARPEELLHNIITLDVSHGPGFPSGHTALATALALTVGHYLPRKYHWIPVVWIIGVAFSRMYLGVHLPLDLLGGFAIGWFSYAIFRQVRIYDNRHK
jgi:undecaprenyl-diphosphatase